MKINIKSGNLKLFWFTLYLLIYNTRTRPSGKIRKKIKEDNSLIRVVKDALSKFFIYDGHGFPRSFFYFREIARGD